MLDGILYVLDTGCRWSAVPPEYGSGATLHRYFRDWVREGVFDRLQRAGLMEHGERLDERIARARRGD